jgi:dihydroxyacetone kinase-like protein
MIKKLLNEPENVVREMLEGFVEAYSDLVVLDPKYNNIYRKNRKKGKVAIITGGGSGHEPAYAGYVGYGMLDAAIAGHVFTSPTRNQILEAIKQVKTEKGILAIIMNYTGDIINFKSALKVAEAEGIRSDMIISNDDVSIKDKERRRGTTITILAHKIAGAASEEGLELEKIKNIASKVIENGRDIGVALTPCSVPGTDKYSFELGENEIELGIGIHGEPGVERMKYIKSSQLAIIMVDKLIKDLNLREDDEIILVVQGMGGTPYMEKFIFYRDVLNYVKKLGIKVYSSWIGEFLTSLEMQGARIAILKLDEELKRYYSAPVLTPLIRQNESIRLPPIS